MMKYLSDMVDSNIFFFFFCLSQIFDAIPHELRLHELRPRDLRLHELVLHELVLHELVLHELGMHALGPHHLYLLFQSVCAIK